MELEAMKKRARASGGGSLVAGEPDRLSALPDCLLHTIMSFMKARQVVQTCVLSKRWRHLWRSAPCLDIDLDEFKTGTANVYVPHNDRDWEDFEDFAINLMLRRNVALLDSFRLNVPRIKAPHDDTELTASWLRRAMKYCAPDPGIQREGLSSNSWRLKRLYLCNIFLDNLFAKHVSSLCHSLEDLELKDCRCQFHAITSLSLKNLVLKDCSCHELSDITSPTLKSMVIDGGSNSYGCLVITAPAVAYLRLVGVGAFYAGISINEMPSLHKASIHLRGNRASVIESKLGQDQLKLLCSVSNVTHLELSDLGTMVLSEDSTTFKEFKNLRNLLLDNCDLSDDFQTLALLLQNSPNLEKLTLRCCKSSNDSKKKKGTLSEDSTTFKEFKNLRNLLLDNCDLSDDFQTLALLLQNSPNLEKLTLRCCKSSNDSKKKKGTLKPKNASSSQCHILDVRCANLKLTEIIYKDNGVHLLVELLLRISGNLPENQLKLRKVD